MGWPLAGSIIGAATSFWQSNQARKDAKSQFNQTSLTARVNEARRLGLSPLAVLGSPTASPTIMASTGQSDLGSQLKDVISNLQKQDRKVNRPKNKPYLETRAELAAVRQAEAQADMAELELERSRTALLSQAGQPIPPPSAELTGPRGGKWQTSRSTKQQEVEDEYGGAVGELYGLHRAWQDKRSQDRKKPPPAYYKGSPKGTMPKGYKKGEKRKFIPNRYGGF